MTKLILTALVVVGGGIFWAWKRYGSKSAEIARKRKQVRKIREEMRDALRNRDYTRHAYLSDKRKLLNAEINDLCR